MPKPLSVLFTAYGSDKAANAPPVLNGRGHSYGPVYDALLAPRRESLAAVLEVGVSGGSSIRAWREWVPDACRVVGIDNNLVCGEIAGAELYSCDSMDADAVERVLGDSTFDVIVDDGGHALHEQQATWAVMLPRLRPGGVYVVEDLQSGEARDWFAQRGCVIHDNAGLTGKWDDALAVYIKPAE